MDDVTATERERSSWSFGPTIGLAGFGVLLGWHFLVLYFSFPMTESILHAEFALIRQVVLNASLCAFFGLFGYLMANLPQRDCVKSHTIIFSAIGIGTVGNIVLVAGSVIGVSWSVFAVILIGASESALMLLWLRFYTETSENYSSKSLSASAVLAALICFFTYHLTPEVSVFILMILPIASGVLLISTTKDIPLRKNDPLGLGSGIPDWKPARKPYWKTTAQLMAMALFFGAVQGCSSSEKTLLPAADPTTILGAALAGIVLYGITVFLTTDRPPWEAAFYKSKAASDRKKGKGPEEEEPGVDVIHILSERYALTPREVEIFGMLSRGRNAEFIQNALVISNHTVKTHIYNIYRKMDIHSLQELLDVLDDEDIIQKQNQASSTSEDLPERS